MKNNYFKNVKAYLKENDNFFEGEWAYFEDDFKRAISSGGEEERGLLWLKHVAAYHIDEDSGSKYWIEKAKERGITVEKIYKCKSRDELVKLLGDSDSKILKEEDGYSNYYKPKRFSLDELYKSSSSGTTGPAKTVYHSKQSLILSAINEYTGIISQYGKEFFKGKKLLSSGPLGAYQEEHKKLAELLQMQYIDNGFETKGLKLLSPEELKEKLSSIIGKTIAYLSTGEVGLMTGSMEMIPAVPFDLLKSAGVIKLSGTAIESNAVGKLISRGLKVVPMYGHYAGKSSIGFINKYDKDKVKGITYFPTFPVTQYIFSDQGDYKSRQRIKLIVAEPELLLINDEDYVNVQKTRKEFKPLKGISDIGRS